MVSRLIMVSLFIALATLSSRAFGGIVEIQVTPRYLA